MILLKTTVLALRKAFLRNSMKAIAKALREEDPKKNTQAKIAVQLGVAQNTVSDWFIKKGSNIGSDNTSVPDARVKVPPKSKLVLAVRMQKGISEEIIATRACWAL